MESFMDVAIQICPLSNCSPQAVLSLFQGVAEPVYITGYSPSGRNKTNFFAVFSCPEDAARAVRIRHPGFNILPLTAQTQDKLCSLLFDNQYRQPSPSEEYVFETPQTPTDVAVSPQEHDEPSIPAQRFIPLPSKPVWSVMGNQVASRSGTQPSYHDIADRGVASEVAQNWPTQSSTNDSKMRQGQLPPRPRSSVDYGDALHPTPSSPVIPRKRTTVEASNPTEERPAKRHDLSLGKRTADLQEGRTLSFDPRHMDVPKIVSTWPFEHKYVLDAVAKAKDKDILNLRKRCDQLLAEKNRPKMDASTTTEDSMTLPPYEDEGLKKWMVEKADTENKSRALELENQRLRETIASLRTRPLQIVQSTQTDRPPDPPMLLGASTTTDNPETDHQEVGISTEEIPMPLRVNASMSTICSSTDSVAIQVSPPKSLPCQTVEAGVMAVSKPGPSWDDIRAVRSRLDAEIRRRITAESERNSARLALGVSPQLLEAFQTLQEIADAAEKRV